MTAPDVYKGCTLLPSLGTWHYRAEGNSNIVIALNKASQYGLKQFHIPSSRKLGQILRIPKIQIGAELYEYDYDWKRQRKQLEREVSFATNVIAPLIGSQFIGAIEIVMLSPEQIAELNVRLKSVRPAHRIHKVLGIPFGTRRTDFTSVNSNYPQEVNYCVEIKLKQGWWFKGSSSKETPNLCSFCLKQFLKIKDGKATLRSAYCPIDLFSGDPFRIVNALVALTQNPQNNFRIFRNGDLLYGDSISGGDFLNKVLQEWFSGHGTRKLDVISPGTQRTYEHWNLSNLIYLLTAALLNPTAAKAENVVPDTSIEAFEELMRRIGKVLKEHPLSVPPGVRQACQPDGNCLPKGCILSRVLMGQKLGMDYDSKAIFEIYYKFCPVHSSKRDGPVWSCPSKHCLVKDDIWPDELGKGPSAEERAIVNDYLVAATMKDCSIMLTFCKVEGGATGNAQDLDGRKYEINIGIADLDPKPVTCIARHFVTEMDIIQAYSQFNPASTFEISNKNEH